MEIDKKNMEVNLTLSRERITHELIKGELYLNDNYFCDTLESRQKSIPYGKYEITVVRSPRFRRNLPRLIEVPKRSGILIHRGNYVKDTDGCILVGESKGNAVLNSTKYEIELTEILTDYKNKGFKIWIEIV